MNTEQSVYLRKNLRAMLKRLVPNFKTTFVFINPKLKSYLSTTKDKIHVALRASVVYKLECEIDSRLSYIEKANDTEVKG